MLFHEETGGLEILCAENIVVSTKKWSPDPRLERFLHAALFGRADGVPRLLTFVDPVVLGVKNDGKEQGEGYKHRSDGFSQVHGVSSFVVISNPRDVSIFNSLLKLAHTMRDTTAILKDSFHLSATAGRADTKSNVRP